MALGIDDCKMTDVQDIANVIFPGDDCNKVRGQSILASMKSSRSSKVLGSTQ